MISLLLAGAASLALQTPEPTPEQDTNPAVEPAVDPGPSPLDTLVDDNARSAAPALAPTGDPVLDRLNAMEARIRQLEARNAELEQQAELNQERLESVETRAAKAAQFTWAPTIADTTGAFTFKPRGVVEADGAAFFERRGGYDYNNGTGFRRARTGLEGTALKWFNYRIEVDFAGNVVNLTDAYLQYTKIPKVVLTLGQHKAPFGLESNNSDNYNMFMERGMFTNAFGNAVAERRIGFSAAYAPRETINVAVGAFGDNESIGRSNNPPALATNTPDESWGFNGRATWEPLFQPGKIIHLGLSGAYRTALKAGDVEDAVRLTDRPNIRIDNGNIADTGLISAALGGGGAAVKSLRYGGLEAAGVFGPLTLAGEYGKVWLDREGAGNISFNGFYGYASYFITGETRPFRGGNFDRVRPFTELGKDGLGAFEVALRYDKIDLSNTPGCRAAPTTAASFLIPCAATSIADGNEASSITLGLNWYFNPFAKLMFNWVRFRGDNTPLDPVGDKAAGDVLATRLHLDF
ncbi:porin [Sphingomonas sp. GCM10030256]|uniref:porin n=1 Tax=Sphingomonas sp. GCM10030256 TaxID=3273427 RepID=UPI003623FB2B